MKKGLVVLGKKLAAIGKVFAIMLLFSLLPTFVSSDFERVFGNADTLLGVSAKMIGYMIGCALTIFVIWLFTHETTGKLAKAVNFKPKETAKCTFFESMALGAGFNLFLSTVFTLLEKIRPSWFTSYNQSSSGVILSGNVVLNVIWVVCFAPIVEEIIFRGYIMNTIKSGFGVYAGVFATAIIFGMCHGGKIWVLYAALMGVILSWLAVRLDNIAYSAAFHVGFNLMALPPTLIPKNTHIYDMLYGQTINIVLIGVFGLVILSVMLARITNKIKKREVV